MAYRQYEVRQGGGQRILVWVHETTRLAPGSAVVDEHGDTWQVVRSYRYAYDMPRKGHPVWEPA